MLLVLALTNWTNLIFARFFGISQQIILYHVGGIDCGAFFAASPESGLRFQDLYWYVLFRNQHIG
jgi:hypothetical protein